MSVLSLSEIRKPEVTHPIEKTIGEKESRGATLNGSRIHSIRLPSFVLSVEAILGAKNERLTIRHDAGSAADPYIQGTLLAVHTYFPEMDLKISVEPLHCLKSK